MTQEQWFDPSHWFGVRVVSPSGTALGRITAAIHHRTGCDVLIERRRWLHRRAVLRVDLSELVRIDERTCRHSPGRLRVAGGSDDWSVA